MSSFWSTLNYTVTARLRSPSRKVQAITDALLSYNAGTCYVDDGVPCHLELRWDALQFVDLDAMLTPWDDGFQTTSLKYAPPRWVVVVTHSVPGAPVSKKELAGPAYKLDFTPKPGEQYSIHADVIIDYTVTSTRDPGEYPPEWLLRPPYTGQVRESTSAYALASSSLLPPIQGPP